MAIASAPEPASPTTVRSASASIMPRSPSGPPDGRRPAALVVAVTKAPRPSPRPATGGRRDGHRAADLRDPGAHPAQAESFVLSRFQTNPLSVTASRTPESEGDNSTVTALACACLRIFAKASCVARSSTTSVAMFGGGRSSAMRTVTVASVSAASRSHCRWTAAGAATLPGGSELARPSSPAPRRGSPAQWPG